MKKLVLYTAGSGSQEILLALRDMNKTKPTWEPVAFVDEDPAKKGKSLAGLPIVGPDEEFGEDVYGICGAWDPDVRRRMSEELIENRGMQLATIIHPSAFVSDDLEHGPGLVLMPGSTVSFGVKLGKGVMALWNCILGHGLEMGDYATALTGATILADCKIGHGATIGGGAVVNSGAVLGDKAMVGVGTTLLGKVADGKTIMSLPRQMTRDR